ncbi:glucose-6-phosphate isomerase [Actinomadura vinacea]|uniref:Glucose-6-phosphate isomerase n=1 Tax=Actinomadura vinacea TaxID=115336 RepID=A0ABN3K8F9_9ACTN
MTSVVTAGGISVTMRGAVVDEAEPVLARLVSDGVPVRLASGASAAAGAAGRPVPSRAARLWGPDAAAAAERSLGWLELPERSRALPGRLAELAGEARGAGLDRVVLAGTGCAAPAPEVIARTAGVELTVLDGTDPHQARAVLDDDRLARTLVVLADTADPRSAESLRSYGEPEADLVVDAYRRVFERAFERAGITGAELRRRFLVCAVPGSPLAERAGSSGYRLVPADADAAGAFAALGAASLVPAALAGADVARLLDEAAALAATLRQPYDNPALALGAALGSSAQAGRDKLFVADQGSGLAGLGGWVEQLVAGATGKDGKGVLPVVVEGVEAPGFEASGVPRRVLLGRRPDDAGPGREAGLSVTGPLGGQFLLWQYAAAVAGRVLGVDPFGRPDVRESEDNAAALLRSEEGASPTVIARAPALVSGAVEVHGPEELLGGARTLTEALEAVLAAVPERGYLAVMAYLDRWGDPDAGGLRSLLAERGATKRRTPVPVTFGWAPRCLPGPGQYHKGGPPNGVFLQVTGNVVHDVPVPGRPYTLGQLQLAQAFGDMRVLRARGRPAVRLHLRDRVDGPAQLFKALTA